LQLCDGALPSLAFPQCVQQQMAILYGDEAESICLLVLFRTMLSLCML